jgi:hypothetical protein
MTAVPNYQSMLAVALEEARLGLKEGGIPVGAAIFDRTDKLVSPGHNPYLIALCQNCPSLVRRLVGVSRWQPSSPDRARDGDLLEIRNDRFASRYRVLHGGQR